MEFRGVCKTLDKIVVSDPSYGEGVWCRYERNDIGGTDWNVHGFINAFAENVEGYDVSGVEFVVALSAPGEHMELHEDGSFAHYAGTKANEFTIGMDTACVGLGVNGVADEIKASREEWQPDCCLKTLTDGQFGNVYEGVCDDQVKFIVISGYLDDDTGYSQEDILNYLVSALDFELERSLTVEELIRGVFEADREQFKGPSKEKADEMLKNILDSVKSDKDDMDLS